MLEEQNESIEQNDQTLDNDGSGDESNNEIGTFATQSTGSTPAFCGCTPVYTFAAGPLKIDYTYTTNASGNLTKISSISSISAYDTTATSWVDTVDAAYNITGSKTASIEIRGYHLLGVAIGGFDEGMKHSASYTETISVP
ncbi:hypothetical protein [Alteribacillus sp. HJP-4]|uniref:hypothetical protein n=1 Tax=Alteribacillus sp. HJP-4 TaxID=2775394 RepID=UPI0035CCDFF0